MDELFTDYYKERKAKYESLIRQLRSAAQRWRKENPVVGVGEMRYDFALEDAADALEKVV